MNFLDRWDENFVRRTVDPQKRKQQIEVLSEARPVLFWCAAVLALVFIADVVGAIVSRTDFHDGLILGYLASLWGYYEFEQQLRLLKLVDRLQNDGTRVGQPPHGEAISTNEPPVLDGIGSQ